MWAGNIKHQNCGVQIPTRAQFNKGEIMTLDEQIDQLLVELIFEEVSERTIERLKQLGVEVQ